MHNATPATIKVASITPRWTSHTIAQALDSDTLVKLASMFTDSR